MATETLAADRLAVSAITWLELAWLARHERILVTVPLRTWLATLSQQILTTAITPAVAALAVELPSIFPRDPADRLIFSTAVEHGWKLATKDSRIRKYPAAKDIVVW